MRKLSIESKVTLIYKIMRDNISTGLWHEGDQFSSFDVARKYGIGRTTVNDAIKILEKKGFVDILPNVGFKVSAITVQSIREYLEVRLAIELIVSKYLQTSDKPMEVGHIKDRFRLAITSFNLGQHEVALQGIEEYHLSIAEMLESKSVRNLLIETEDLEYYILNQIMVKNPECFVQVLEFKQEYLDRIEEKNVESSQEVLIRKKEVIEECIVEILAREGADE
ncbi:GntR family transcriptional regulator [Clostridia bacterium]|nr:GntR family transcriptional regulator [Clostridia bacterium]